MVVYDEIGGGYYPMHVEAVVIVRQPVINV